MPENGKGGKVRKEQRGSNWMTHERARAQAQLPPKPLHTSCNF